MTASAKIFEQVSGTPLRADAVRVHPPAVLGISCAQCGRQSFPQRDLCPHCGGAQVRDVDLSRYGDVVSWTVVHQAPPPLETPYRLVTVDLDDGVRLLGRAVGSPEIGDRVEVRMFELRTDDSGKPLFWYRFHEVTEE